MLHTLDSEEMITGYRFSHKDKKYWMHYNLSWYDIWRFFD